MKITRDSIPIEVVNDPAHLQIVVERLKMLQEFAMDTEFDSFNKQYGITLQLVQVFDGTTCFLIDPIAIKNLEPLWSVFENKKICKLVYAGANDVDILKRHGCSPANLFDIQIAAALCKWPVTSLSAVLHQEFEVMPNKSLQAAGWGNRPLSDRQMVYAANDVVYLLRLKELLLSAIREKELDDILQEQNLKLESASSKDYYPKLNDRQRRSFSRYSQQKLLALKILVDEYAKEVNLPPFKIVADSFLEEVVQNVKTYLTQPFPEDKFHYKVNTNPLFKKAFLEIVHAIDPEIAWAYKRSR
ncbi:MAG: ribonuclease D [Bacteroidota bacterium]